jgi:hypothetical protein
MDIWDLWLIAAVGIAAFYVARWFRFAFRKWRSVGWPTASGTVQRGEVSKGGPNRFTGSVYRSRFGYVYHVQDSMHVGFFVLLAPNEQTANEFQKQLQGRHVNVKYDPKRPDVSLVVESEFLGKPIIQNPDWLF